MLRELRGEAIAVRVPHPQIPLRDLRLGVVGVEVQAVVAHVMHGHVDLVGLALIVGRGFGERLARVAGAVDPHLDGAGLAHGDVAVAAELVPILGRDDEAEVLELAVEGEVCDLAVAVLAGERMVHGRHVGAGGVLAPDVDAPVRGGLIGRRLVVHDETGLRADRLRVAHAERAVLDADLRDALGDQVVGTGVAVPVATAVVEADLVLLALGVDRLLVVTLRVRSFHLLAGASKVRSATLP